MQEPGVVTPEAVRLQFEAAGVGSRAVAFAIDGAARFTLLLVLFLGLALVAGAGVTVPGMPAWAGVTVAVLLGFAAFWGYPIALETLWRGRTLGKAALGLRVVTREGGPVRFRHAVLRAVMEIPDFWATSGAAGLVCALVTRDHQRLGDLVAGTLVLRERTTGGRPAAVSFGVPAGAERYAATLDVTGLSPADYATVRGFLLRAAALRPQARGELARRIGDPVAARIGHRPPEGVTWEMFLACVAARYQQRGGATVRPEAPAVAESEQPEPPPFAPPG